MPALSAKLTIEEMITSSTTRKRRCCRDIVGMSALLVCDELFQHRRERGLEAPDLVELDGGATQHLRRNVDGAGLQVASARGQPVLDHAIVVARAPSLDDAVGLQSL